MKRTILTVAIIAMLVSLFVFPTSAAEVPAPYADLAFNADGTLYDAAGNTEISFVSPNGAGKVSKMEVTLDDGQVHNAWAARLTEAFEIIEFYFPKFETQEQYVEFANKGFTLELYAAYDAHVEETSGLFGSNSSGGIGLLVRGRAAGAYEDALEPSHQIMFQMGINDKEAVTNAGGWTNGTYAYVGDNKLGSGNVTDTELLDEHLGKLVHIVALYDPAAQELRMYFNGVHVQTGPVGANTFRPGKADFSIMTVGHNASATGESYVEHSPITVTEARIYDCALSTEQVFAAYTKCREDIILGKNGPEGDAPVTEAPVTEAPVTEAPVTEAPVTEAPVTEAPATEAPVTEAPTTDAPVTEAPTTDAPTTEAPKDDKGCGGVIGIGAIVAILGTAVVLKKRD